MKNIIFFDDSTRNHLLPLTFTRPVGELRIGILTIREKWEKRLGGKASYITESYLSESYPLQVADENYVINGSALPSEPLCRLINQLDTNEALLLNGDLIAARLPREQFTRLLRDEEIDELKGFELGSTRFLKINHLWDIFSLNGPALENDFQLLTQGRESKILSSTNTLIAPENIFVEEGAQVEGAILNASTGPIYIGREATIMEGSLVRGALALCDNATLKMGAKIYGPTTIGPYSKVGGEVQNTVITGYSNKGHDGYLGNAVLGEWCNIGAGSNNSNLKNTYAEVRLWDYPSQRFVPTGLQFCGLIMGDHSKCAINTVFNTGTVVGIFANLFGAGFPRNFVPSFAWGGHQGYSTYQLDKALGVAETVMARRNKNLEEATKKTLQTIYEDTAIYRKWEKKT